MSEDAAREMMRRIVRANREGRAVGAYSVCSAHPWVLEAALAQAGVDGWLALIESTSNQVNQFGGYTGKTPEAFARDVRELAVRAGFPAERLLLGGDHLGPYPWRKQPAEEAMANARAMVADYVRAGYIKIHLDASMALGGESGGAAPLETAARRAADLCRAAEDARRQLPDGSPAPLYVIGTEVPVPGGEQLESGAPAATRPEDAAETVEAHRAAFARLGLDEAFQRVIGLVVQPGVEFGSAQVFAYDRESAKALSERLPVRPELVYEAHSTDYQTGAALAGMVEDHFAILKVGPWLTYALREAIFALGAVEAEWLGWRRGVTLSRVAESLEAAMLDDPRYWRDYYSGDEDELRLARKYSYSDRIRYYWPDTRVQAEVDLLVKNLAATPPPLNLVSQFLPAQYEAVRAGALENEPVSLIEDRVAEVLELYANACGASPEAAEVS
ncbi:MAG: class II D-tagatose-bisphosphate aldolase, non-catalytic subunit [Bryobacteraceae bacterium]|nr:class II D-tagatose-bisphosphate aldolase, non-catalytic subunit [Bryobacteraceae bacterium]